MNKKNNIILTIAIILFIGLIIFLVINHEEVKTGALEELTYKEVQEKIDNKEDFVIVLSQTTCSHCAEYKPTIKQIAKKHKITIYYLDYDKYKKQEKKIIEKFNFDGGTPTTFFYKDGKETSVMNRLIVNVTSSKVIAMLKKLEYIETENE